jgi:hypothetical protein
MAQRHAPPAQQVQVAERVTFRDGHRTVAGHVARKGRTYAHVVTDAGTEVRVPYRLLTRDLGTPRQPVQSRTDILRAQWHAGDRVAFAVGSAVLHGTISRVNPRYAHVVCDDDREYRVPYARLRGCQVKCVTFSHLYPLPKQQHKLIEGRFPLRNGLGPLFGHVLQPHIQHFHDRLVIRERAAPFQHLPQGVV